jgi:hypothetical protein
MDPILTSFDHQFSLIDKRSRELLSAVSDGQLFEKPRDTANSIAPFSIGEYILRSAAMVEKTFGGITTRLWDDPFEWTLPEKLGTGAAIIQYLNEVEETRAKGFSFFTSDSDLTRKIPAPEQLRAIHDILLETVAAASHFQGRAFAVIQMLSAANVPRLKF